MNRKISKKVLGILIMTLCFALAVTAGCSKDEPAATPDAGKTPDAELSFQYYTPDQLKTAIENKDAIYLLDIQLEDDYNAHHIIGAVPTYAYPADTPELTAKLDAIVPDLKATTDPIVVVCPGGGTGAKNTITYLVSQGIPETQMFILEKGQKGWPHADLLEK